MQLPMFLPNSDWESPRGLPTIRNETIGVDTEVRDDGLANDLGPGWALGMGYIAGVSVAWPGGEIYVPIRHVDTECHDKSTVARWVDALFRENVVIFHNSMYDLGWIKYDLGVGIPERFEDSMIAAAMLDENRRGQYNLDAVARWRGVPGKNEDLLKEAALAFGINPKAEMWKIPARFVGPYAEDDAVACLRCFQDMYPEIVEKEIDEAYRLEITLVPHLLEMRRRGIRVDSGAAERAIAQIDKQRDDLLKNLGDKCGRRLTIDDLGKSDVREQLFDSEGVHYPRTPKTNRGSFKKAWMEKHEHWLPRTINHVNQLQRLSHVFIENFILGSVHRGRIHSEMHSTNSDTGGTRTSRFSYSNPPLQQMPSKVDKADPDNSRKEAVRAIRTIFLPEKDTVWTIEDYSQQEPRLTIHFAALTSQPGAETAIQYFVDDENADYHDMVKEMTGLSRDNAKIINLALAYDKRLNALARDLSVSVDEAQVLMNQYHERLPFMRPLHNTCERLARNRGYVRLIDGARRNFNSWDTGYKPECPLPPVSQEEANRIVKDANFVCARGENCGRCWYGQVPRRANTRVAMNALIQGSAARQTKRAMVICAEEGLLPMLQMHDDLNFSLETDAQSERAGQIMRDAIPLKLPVKVDREHGRNWGEATFTKYKTVREVLDLS